MTSVSPAQEDYLEAIFVLQKGKKNVRVKDLAQFLKVKAPSVIDAMSHLKEMGLIEQEPYGAIELTISGMHMAKEIYGRHSTLKTFFYEILGLNEGIAEEDACKIEHYLSKKAVQRLLKFITFIEIQTKSKTHGISSFNAYLEQNK